MRPSLRSGLIAASILAMFGAPAVTADTLPPTLSGEFFLDTPVSITATCNPGATSTMSFSANGTASGPYPGTFTETGTITIGSTPTGGAISGIPFYQVTVVDAVFTISSPVGQVTGTKQLAVGSNVSGLCNDFNTPTLFGGSLITGTFREISPDNGFGLTYDATIETSTGMFGDVGRAGLLINQLQLTTVDPPGTVEPSNVLNQFFQSTGSSVFPISRIGHATGGGQIGSSVNFGFQAESDGGLRGGCTVLDRAGGTKVKCLDVTSFSESGTHVTFWGHATVNGAAATYRIDVDDIAEPGIGVDKFAISTSAGFSAAGTLSQGNIQIHG